MMKKLSMLATVFLLVLLIALLILNKQLALHVNQQLPVNEPLLLTVESGDTMSRFSRHLKSLNLIETRFWFRLFIKLNPELSQLKQGTYQVNQQDTLLSLLNKVAKGQEHQFQVTFVEGITLQKWLEQLAEQTYIIKTEHTENLASIANALKLTHQHPEGWFFPDTYSYTAGTKDIELLKRAHSKMSTVLHDEWEGRAQGLPYDTPYQALIMASIIEKETGKMSEQPRIAAVFINRLNKKMRLQTDPTVIYGLGDRYQGDITRAHLKEKTAYNTYRINGLPPTPIAMPGLSALKAALNPEQSDYYYFVSMGNGEHKFSKTLAEHNSAVAKYQLGKS